MRKFYSFVVALAVLAFAVPAYADNADALNAGRIRNGSQTSVTTDGSSGATQEVSAHGDSYIRHSTKEVEISTQSTEVIKSACTIYHVMFNGAAAGTRVDIYDALETPGAYFQAGRPVLEVETGIAYEIIGGMLMSYGVSQDIIGPNGSSSSAGVVMIQYDTDTRS